MSIHDFGKSKIKGVEAELGSFIKTIYSRIDDKLQISESEQKEPSVNHNAIPMRYLLSIKEIHELVDVVVHDLSDFWRSHMR